MPNGFQEDFELERELDEIGDDPVKLGRMLARRMFRIEKNLHESPCIPLQEMGEKVSCNSRFILTAKQWAIVFFVAVIGGGGGETLFDWIVKVATNN